MTEQTEIVSATSRPFKWPRPAVTLPWILAIVFLAMAVGKHRQFRSYVDLNIAVRNERRDKEDLVRLGVARVMQHSWCHDVFDVLGTEIDRDGHIWVYAAWRSWKGGEYPTQRQKDEAARAMVAEVMHQARRVQIFVFLHPGDYAEYLETRNLELITDSVKAEWMNNWRVKWWSRADGG